MKVLLFACLLTADMMFCCIQFRDVDRSWFGSSLSSGCMNTI